jgi:hypothetical protein
VLAGPERLDDEGSVRPPLREEGDGVDGVVLKHGLEALTRAREPQIGDELLGAALDDIRRVDLRDARVQLEEGREVGRELSRSHHSESESHGRESSVIRCGVADRHVAWSIGVLQPGLPESTRGKTGETNVGNSLAARNLLG